MPAHALTRAQAAENRRAGTNQRTHRPQKRTSPGGGRSHAPARVITLAAGDPASSGMIPISGCASATGPECAYEMWDWYGEYEEIIAPGAFASTLNRVDLQVPLVIGHDQIRRIASTMNGTLILQETSVGLQLDAQCDPADMDVAYIVPKIRAGLIREMSFAFRIESGIWSPDYEQYTITSVDMHRGDVAIVGFGANPSTSVSADGSPVTTPTLVPCDCPDCGTCPDCPSCPCECSCGGGKKLSAQRMTERQRALALADIALAG